MYALQSVYPEEPAALTEVSKSVTLEGANEAEANVTLTSTVAEWLWQMIPSFRIMPSGVTFKAKSKNTTGDVRTTVATVTTGTGTAAKSEVTVNQNVAAEEALLGGKHKCRDYYSQICSNENQKNNDDF